MSGSRPAGVPQTATQAGDIRGRWSWTEPSVWTDRMLTALENGVKGGVWYSLMDKVYAGKNLEAAKERVVRNQGCAGVDHVSVEAFVRDWPRQRQGLEETLREGTYRPQGILRHYIPKAGSKEERPLGIPTVRDRVVQTAIRQVIEPIFDREFALGSYGFRPGRGCRDALREVVRRMRAGYVYVVDADLRRYFDTIPHEGLMERVRERVADGRVLGLIEGFLKQGVMEGLSEWKPEAGTPQGAVISPVLANVYLNPLDHEMHAHGYGMIRYADDLVILCRTQTEASQALDRLRQWTQAAGLQLHPEKTRIVDMSARGNGFDFLGYHFERTQRSGRIRCWPRSKSLQKFRDRIRDWTPRQSGHSLAYTIGRINPVARGWFVYFQHSIPSTFVQLDKWIRMRLRSILRRRRGRTGCGRGTDHQRWPNSYFAAHGLFSLSAAHAKARQSVSR